jgi:diaminopimelate decarboxylase
VTQSHAASPVSRSDASQVTGTVAGGSELAPDWLPYPTDVNALLPVMWPQDVTRTDGALSVDGIDVADLKERFGTPLFVMSEGDFRARARAFKDAFDEAFADICGGVDVYYAGKSFLCTEVARWVDSEGLRLDTCSGGEMAVAVRAGLTGDKLGLHGNNKSDAELRRALDLKVGRIVVDSLAELARVDAMATARGEKARVMLRLTPGVHAHTHEFIATAHEDQKFGLSMVDGDGGTDGRGDGGTEGRGDGGTEGRGDGAGTRAGATGTSPAAQAVAQALAAPGIELIGLHCHIGSQIFEPDGFELAAERLLGFLARVKAEHGVDLPELDLGGGYGIAYVPTDTPRPAREIANAMAAVVQRTCERLGITPPRISIEPGRAIVGSTTFTLYEAGTIKDVNVELPAADAPSADATPASGPVTRVRRYVSVDGGMSDNARPVLYDADYSAVLAGRSSEAAPVLSRVVGKHCESGDIVVRDVYLPEDVAAGDLLAVPGTGAYCYALASNYNYVPRPPVVAVANGTARLILRGETEDDLLARDLGA